MDNLDVELELKLTLHFHLIKPEKMTQSYPGHPGSIEIDALSIMDIEVPEVLFRELMNEYEDAFIEEILDKADDGERGLRVDHTGIYYKYKYKNKGETYV